MNPAALRVYNMAYGVYCIPQFLSVDKQQALIDSTKMLWSSLYKRDADFGNLSLNTCEPFCTGNLKPPHTGLRWYAKDYEELKFHGNHNFPLFLKSNFTNEIYFLLKNSILIPELHQGVETLRKSNGDLNIGINYSMPQSPQERDFSCGGLSTEKTAMMVYMIGPANLFYLSEKSTADMLANRVVTPIPVPQNSLILFTNRVFKPNEKYVLPFFRETMPREQTKNHLLVSKLFFTFKY